MRLVGFETVAPEARQAHFSFGRKIIGKNGKENGNYYSMLGFIWG